ncbi:MAG: hypothetical protein UDJ85_03660, partial [Clostridia bacterium]|nr:hypothetical protein [Clostridia bacterium]
MDFCTGNRQEFNQGKKVIIIPITVNNKIKVAKRIGYGYRNDDHFFTLIKFLSIPRAKNPSPR